jgi:hypothetical protein
MEPPCAENLGYRGRVTPYLLRCFKLVDQELTRETRENDDMLRGLSPLGTKWRGDRTGSMTWGALFTWSH